MADASDLESDIIICKGSSPFSYIYLKLSQSGGIGKHMGLKIPRYKLPCLFESSLWYFFILLLKGESIMKIINSGNTYHIYNDNVKTFDQFEPNTYKINFSPMSGFSIEKTQNLKPSENKVYGDHYQKIDKVIKTYDLMNRSLGILLSGDKGIGKSLFVQLLATKYIEKGYPVFIIDKSYPGLFNYIDSIQQEVVVIFDEFEKTFDKYDDDVDSQHDILGLLDGTSSQKRLYLATINDLNSISSFLINRPGRFHYHFRFNYPSYDEVIQYLKETTSNVKESEIINAAIFSQQVKLNFDMLRAIAFELNLGESFEDAVKDLNIIAQNIAEYRIEIEMNDESKFEYRSHINLLDDNDHLEINLAEFELIPSKSSVYDASSLIQIDKEEKNSIQYTNEYIVIKPYQFELDVMDERIADGIKRQYDLNDVKSIKLYPDHYTDRLKYF